MNRTWEQSESQYNDQPGRNSLDVGMGKRKLGKLFSSLPKALLNSNGRICWYCSAGVDRGVLRYFHGCEQLLGGVRLFLFTDNDYTIRDGVFHYPGMRAFQPGGEIMPPFTRVEWSRQVTFHSDIGPCDAFLECVGISNTTQHFDDDNPDYRRCWIIYIRIDNWVFEHTMIARRLGIDVLCDAGGMRGQGPQDPGRLGVRYALTEIPPEEYLNQAMIFREERGIPAAIPYSAKGITTVPWGVNGRGAFYEITPCRESCPAGTDAGNVLF